MINKKLSKIKIGCYLCDSYNLKLERIIDGTSYYRCMNCNLLQQVPIQNIGSIDERYEDGEKYFNDPEKGINYASEEIFFNNTSKFYYTILKQYLNKSNIRICDFGASTGFFINFLKKKGFVKVDGIEPSNWAAKYAMDKYGIKVFNNKIEDIKNFGIYDIFVSFHVIEHLPDPLNTFKIINKHMESNGLLMVATPNSKNLTIKLVGNKWKHFLPNEHLYLFDPKSIKYFLKKCGFEILEIHKCLYDNLSVIKYFRKLLPLIIKYYIKLVLTKFGQYDSKKIKRIKFLTNRDGMIIIARKI